MKLMLRFMKPYTARIIITVILKFLAVISELFIPYTLEYVIDDIAPTKNMKLVALYGIPRKIIGDFNIDDRNLGCPTIDIESNGKVYAVVDWRTLEETLKEKGLI